MTLQDAFDYGLVYQTTQIIGGNLSTDLIPKTVEIINSTDSKLKEAFKIGMYKSKLIYNFQLNDIELNELVSLCFNCRVLSDTTDILNYIIDNYPSIIKKQKLIKNICGQVNSLSDYLETNNNNFENTKETIQEYIDELQKILNEFN